MSALDLDDIQGLILRGYHKAFASHVLWHIQDPGGFRRLLVDLTDEVDPETGPFITVATNWLEKRPVGEPATHCVNLAFTYAGLEALGVGEANGFPAEFREGAAARAEEHAGETGENAPEHWEASLRDPDVHAILSVYADGTDECAAVVSDLAARAGGAAREIDRFEANRLQRDDQDIEHFGFVDGLSQPTIEGVEPRIGLDDPFPRVPAGEFVLGQPTQRDRLWDPLPEPAELGRNGSFAAFRVMSQDVPTFNAFLARGSADTGIDRELLAAKLCGRWRNGDPLILRPDGAAGPVAGDERNQFDYEGPGGDPAGLRCPRGAHVRRAFPRGQRVVDDGDGFKRRIVRRGMPYGPEFDPDDPTPDPRGLVGMFICASLENQYEYVMQRWLNDGLFTGRRLGRTRDPMIGANGAADGRFTIPGTPDAEVNGFPQFVTTRGCVYVFLPSMTALRYLATLE